MIIYSAKTKKIPLSEDVYNNIGNFFKLREYDIDLFTSSDHNKLARDVYNTYYTLVSFNNLLDMNVDNAFSILDKYISEHSETKTSVDFRCRNLYDEMYYWNNKYKLDSSDKSVNEIIKKVQSVLSQLAKQGIVKESSCNLKSNYY